MSGLAGVMLHYVDSTDQAMAFKRWLGERRPRPILGLDTETSGLDPYARDAAVRLIQFGDGEHGWAMSWELWKGLALEALTEWEGDWAGHNIASFDVRWIEQHSTYRFPRHKIRDGMIAAHIIDPLGPGALKILSQRIVDPRAAHGQQALNEAMAKNKWTWATVPTDFEPYWCVPETTEILTRDGWKNVNDVRPWHDETLGFDNGELAWTPIYRVQRFKDQPVVRFGNRKWNVVATENHRWLGRRRTYDQGRETWGAPEFMTTREAWRSGSPRDGAFPHETVLQLTGYAEGGKSTCTPDEARIIAWLLADGNIHWQRERSSPNPKIGQSIKKFHDEIRELLKREGAYVSERFIERNRCYIFQVSGTYVQRLWSTYGLHDSLVPFVLSLSQESRRAWLDAWYKAEGTIGRNVLTQNKGRKFDALMLSVFLEGYLPRASSKGGDCMAIRMSTRPIGNTKNGQPVYQDDGVSDVWCPTTVLGSWVARDVEGHIFLTGNCYGALDPVLSYKLDLAFASQVGDGGKYAGIYDLEMAARHVVTAMQQRGARVDLDYVTRTGQQQAEYAAAIMRWCRDHYKISMRANRALVQLFEDLGETITVFSEKTGGKSVDKYQMEIFTHSELPGVAQLAQAVLDMRRASRNATSYFGAIEDYARYGPDGFTVHADIRTLAARTSRMSISAPPLQQIPKRDALVRASFIAREGRKLISVDYSQIEMRLMAHFSEDRDLRQAFIEADATGGDFFTIMGREIYNDPDFIKADKRRGLVKSSLYGKAYGAGIGKMAETAGVPYSQMEPVVHAIDARYPGIKRFMKSVEDIGMRRLRAEGQGYVVTPYGRKLPCDDDKVYTLVNYCLSPSTPILKSDLTHVPAVKIGVGDRLVGFDEHTTANVALTSRGRPYMVRRLRTAVVEAVSTVRKPTLRVTLSDGRVLECSDDHLWLVQHPTKTQPRTRWAPARELFVGSVLHSTGEPWEEDISKGAGWLAGLYDGEGCLTSRATDGRNTSLIFSQNTGAVMDRFCREMDARGFTYHYQPRSAGSTSTTDAVVITGMFRMLRTLGTLRPTRFEPRFESIYEGAALTGGTTTYVQVTKIEDLGEQELTSIQTSTRTLIANGILSHNCHQGHAAEIFKRALVDLDMAGWGDYMVLPVHDEILLDVPEEHVEEALISVPKLMSNMVDYAVPLTADAEGPYTNWGERYA